ncbi:hypothetical protein LCGC14_2811230, partial [marine sediment metagenome]
PWTYVQKKYLAPKYVSRTAYNKLKSSIKADYVTKKVLAQAQDKYEKLFNDLAGKLAEEHKLFTKLEAKFDNIQTDREQINELLDISPEATQETRLRAIQKIMAGKPPPAYQQKTPDKWISDLWKWVNRYY